MSIIISTLKKYFYPASCTTELEGKNNKKKGEKDCSPKEAALKVCNYCKQNFNDCHFSQIDHSKKIDSENWTVSLLIHKGSNKLSDIFSHHVILIIEGFTQDGKKFWRKAHLMAGTSSGDIGVSRDSYSGHSNIGRAEVTSEKYSPFDVKRFKENKQTWRTSRDKVKGMLDQMIREQNNPESTPFRFLGEKSFATVTREYMDTDNPDLSEIKNQNPRDFKRFCRLVKDKKRLEQYKNGYWQSLNKIKKMGVICSIASIPIAALLAYGTDEFNENGLLLSKGYIPSFISPPISYIRDVLLVFTRPYNIISGSSFVIGSSSAFMGITAIEYFSLRPPLEVCLQIEENKEELQFIELRAKITKAVAQNCFNWARKHLRKINVELPQIWLEKFLVIPELYPLKEARTSEISEATQ